MVQVSDQLFTFEQYLDVCNQSARAYELVQGVLRLMTPPTWAHVLLARFLERMFEAEIQTRQQPWIALREIGQRTENRSARLPDLMVVPVAEIESVLNQTAILLSPAVLVVEIVSPSSIEMDYVEKRREYEALGIPEYWIVDRDALGTVQDMGMPKQPTVTIYQFVNGQYQGISYRGDDPIRSLIFPDLHLTAEQIFKSTSIKPI